MHLFDQKKGCQCRKLAHMCVVMSFLTFPNVLRHTLGQDTQYDFNFCEKRDFHKKIGLLGPANFGEVI